MKSKIYKYMAILTITLTNLLISSSVFAQSPQKMSYQAVIRDAGNVLVTSHAVGMRISILQGSVSGTVVYTETQTPTTNANGLVTIEIGGGTGFDAINWASGPYFIKTETDPTGGTNYTAIVGTSQLLSVPYAMFSKTAKTADYNDLTNKPALFDGTWTSLTGKPLYATVATSGNYNDLSSKPTLFDGAWLSLTGRPTTIAGYGITDAISTSHVAYSITSAMITNWNTAYGWGNHAGLYRPITYVPAWSEITGKPISLAGYGIIDAVNITGNQTVTGIKTFSNDLLINGLTVGKGKGSVSSNTSIGYQALYNNITGNSNTAIGVNALTSNTTGSYNTANGPDALYYNTTGNSNTAIGYGALYINTAGYQNVANGNYALYQNTTGYQNTANGWSALFDNTTGAANTANGYEALLHNTTGSDNIANGSGALFNNTTGIQNTANGNSALYFNTTASGNTANGFDALYSNTTGNENTANGWKALLANTTGDHVTAVGSSALGSNTTGAANTALGSWALSSNTTANYNTAAGNSSLMSNTTGSENTAVGVNALLSNTTGGMNVAVGRNALLFSQTNNKNTAVGYNALENNTHWDNTAVGCEALVANTTGFDNTALGMNSLTVNTAGCGNTAVGKNSMLSHITGNNNTAIGFTSDISEGITNATAIGYGASVTSSNKIVLGNASATTVGGYGSWTNYSDSRLKENIVYTNNLGLNFILLLKPVSYNYINDSNKRRRDGLIAQDVEQTLKGLGIEFSGLIIDDDKDKTQNLSYAEFVIPLINAVQEQQKQIDKLKAIVNSLISNQAGREDK